MADNVTITAGTGTTVSTEEVTTLNGAGVSAQHLQRTANAIVTSDGTAIDLPGDATYGLDVDVTRVSGTVTMTAADLDIRDLSYTSDSVAVYGTATVTASDLDVRDLVYTQDSVSIYGTATVTATDLDIRNLNQTQDSVKVGDGTNLIDVDVAPTDAEVNGGKRLLHTEAWLWGFNGTTWDRLRSDTTNGLDVDVTRVGGTVNISGTAVVQDGGSTISVDDGTGSLTVDGTVGLTAGTGAPLPSSHGATLITKTAQYTAQVTGTAFWTPAAGNKVVVTYVQIQATGTTGGSVQLWFGGSADTTYTRGTDAAIFDGAFIPSATSYPGVVINPLIPFVGTDDYVLRVTDSAAINTLTVTVWGYEIA